MTARKLACDGCRKSKVRCDGQEGVSSCSRCAKKNIECTWDTPRSKRGRKSNTNRLSTETGMGLFCLTPRNLIELNYTPAPQRVVNTESVENTSTSFYNPRTHENNIPRGETSSSEEAVSREVGWAHPLPLPLHAQQRLYAKPKSNSLEGLPSFHKIPLSPRSQRPRSLDELGRSVVFSPPYKVEHPGPSQPSPTIPGKVCTTPIVPLSHSLPEDTMDTDLDDHETFTRQSHSMSNSHDSVSEEQREAVHAVSFRGIIRTPGEIIRLPEQGRRSPAEHELRVIRSGVEQMHIKGIRSPANSLEQLENFNGFRGIRNHPTEQIMSQEQEEVRRKCSIGNLLNNNADDEEDNPHYIFPKYPSRK